MSNFSVVQDAPAHQYDVEVTTDATSASATPEVGIKGWYIDILVVVVGLVALFFFAAMGNVFALVGPWVIFMGVLSIRKRSEGRLLRIITGAGLLILSAAVLLSPHHAGPWCVVGGVLGLLAGLGYLASTLCNMCLRLDRQSSLPGDRLDNTV